MRFICSFVLLSIFMFNTSCSSSQPSKMPVRVLIINFFGLSPDKEDLSGERELWVKNLNLSEKINFIGGDSSLYYNPQTQILNMLTQPGNVNASLSTMALGLDSRFDLSEAYILLSGIAGGDPKTTSLGSAIWSRYLVDGDLKHSIDPREMPKGWTHGVFSYLKKEPNQTPVEHLGTDFFEINSKLLEWAYNKTKGIKIPDDAQIQKRRALYTNYPIALEPPFVAIGDNLTASEYWHGAIKTQWAREWVDYLTEHKGKFYTTAMEDTGVLSAITRLSKLGLVNKNRVLSLRTISNYSMQWPTANPYQSFMGDADGYSGLQVSLNSAYLVGSVVVLDIVEHWDQFKSFI